MQVPCSAVTKARSLAPAESHGEGYSFVTRWYIAAPIERVFAVIEDAPAWPSWWKAVVAVETLERGGDDGVGQVTRSVWRSPLGYRLEFDARVIKKAAPEELVVEATGDLVGSGWLRLTREGIGTVVVYSWNVTTRRRWMNLLAPLLRPAFAWNHAVAMRWGGVGLAQQLGVRFEDRS
jgi:uncharacterized protein YndB with AHSA1/START domain